MGKTTLATSLSNELSCKVFVEPAIANPYLEKFYKEPHKYALPLQLWILQQRYQTYVDAAKHIIKSGRVLIVVSFKCTSHSVVTCHVTLIILMCNVIYQLLFNYT